MAKRRRAEQNKGECLQYVLITASYFWLHVCWQMFKWLPKKSCPWNTKAVENQKMIHCLHCQKSIIIYFSKTAEIIKTFQRMYSTIIDCIVLPHWHFFNIIHYTFGKGKFWLILTITIFFFTFMSKALNPEAHREIKMFYSASLTTETYKRVLHITKIYSRREKKSGLAFNKWCIWNCAAYAVTVVPVTLVESYGLQWCHCKTIHHVSFALCAALGI